ncbi:hypothetical protein [Saccharopolyspora rosea]|uniref:hypothetical protein n=1 Tax=Saccharopolyspora rosea TaxID=524884 RepID=UPI0021DA62AE|nr:hypothetical protein [Saccharopolyspora rosea]
MTLNTWVAGNPGTMRAYAQQVRAFGPATERVATSQHQVRKSAEAEWEGRASEAFQNWASQQGRDGDALAELFPALAQAVDVWADQIDTVKARMEQAKQVAREGDLQVVGDAIFRPKPFTQGPPPPLQGNVPAADAKAHSDAVAAFHAAQQAHARQEKAYAEAQATVTQARELEKTAHEQLIQALNANKASLQGLSQSGA